MQGLSRWVVGVVGVMAAGCSKDAPPQTGEARPATGEAKPASGEARPASGEVKPPAKAQTAPPIELVVAGEQQLRLLSIAGGKVIERRELKTSERIAGLHVVGRDLIVVQGGSMMDGEEISGEVSVGVVTAAGIEPIAQPAKKDWAIKPPRDKVKLPPHTKVLSTGSELWMGRCEWGYAPGGEDAPDDPGACTEWSYARLRPAPIVRSQREPTPSAPLYSEPELAAAPGYQVEVIPDPSNSGSGDAIRCVQNGKPTILRQGDGRDYGDLRWVSIEPPMFLVSYLADHPDGSTFTAWEPFEGCTPVDQIKFHPNTFKAGPDGTVAMLATLTARIVWQGRMQATLEGVYHLEFLPPR